MEERRSADAAASAPNTSSESPPPHELDGFGLSDAERARYEWQSWVPDFGWEGQAKLKRSTVLITRCGGLGGSVAYQLTAAGVGRLVIAHAGNVRPSDLNRQLLMTTDWLGRPRMESIVRRLGELNPHVQVTGVAENVSPENVDRLVREVDLVVDCAPLFAERFALNDAIVRYGKPMVECAMYELDAQLTLIVPGQTPCLRCLYPEPPPHWKRQFPVFGAVSATLGSLAAMEAMKWLAGFGESLRGRLLTFDLRSMTTFTTAIARQSDCPTCGKL